MPRRWFGLVLGVLLLLYVFIFGDTGWLVMDSERAQTQELSSKVDDLIARRTELESRTEALKEPAGFELERVARESHFMQRDDETVVHIVGGEDAPDEESGAERP